MKERENKKERQVYKILLCYYETPFYSSIAHNENICIVFYVFSLACSFLSIHNHAQYILLSFLHILCFPPSVHCSQSYNPVSFLNVFLITVYTYQCSSKLYVCIYYLTHIWEILKQDHVRLQKGRSVLLASDR